MPKKTAFFTLQTVTNALDTLFAACTQPSNIETVAVTNAVGRILAVAPASPINLPTFTRSTMDGYAVQATATYGASESLPAYLTIVGSVNMGEQPDFVVDMGQAAEIHTGAMLPDGADAVVMIERTQRLGTDEIEVLAPVAVGENVVQIGEDIAAGSPIMAAGKHIRPQDIGGLLAVGITEVEVYARPK